MIPDGNLILILFPWKQSSDRDSARWIILENSI
jgi:hypothetical protein